MAKTLNELIAESVRLTDRLKALSEQMKVTQAQMRETRQKLLDRTYANVAVEETRNLLGKFAVKK